MLTNELNYRLVVIEDAYGGSSPHPQTTPPSDLWVLCEHLHLPKARQVEFKARIIAMVFAANSTCQTKRMLQQIQKCMTKGDTGILFFAMLSCT